MSDSHPRGWMPGLQRRAFGALVFVCFCFAGMQAQAVPLSFNDFYTDPGAPVTVAADGSTATLSEDPGFAVVLLSDVPGFGDANLIVPASGALLSLSYSFSEPTGNDDVFHIALLDGVTGSVLDPAFEFFFSDSASGVIQFDLSSLVGMTLGLQMELVAGLGDGALDSILQLSNLDLTVPGTEPTPVPEPSSTVLFVIALGLLGLGRLLPRKRRIAMRR